MAMTILINMDLCTTREIENSTIVHECCHVYLDLPFFKLQMLSGKPFTSYTSRKRKKKQYSRSNGPIDWMEQQAEKLPAYVLMEEETTKRQIEDLLAQRGGGRTPENMLWVMQSLASFHNVSRSMAKYRMIELGYPEAEGVYVYVDNQHIQSLLYHQTLSDCQCRRRAVSRNMSTPAAPGSIQAPPHG